MSKKAPYKDIQDIFLEGGCQLITTEEDYKGSYFPLEYICECGEKSKIRVNHFKKGQRCRACGSRKSREKLITPFSEIRNLFNNEGYEVISDKNDYDTRAIEYKCPKGHTRTIKLSHFKDGVRCSDCVFGNRKLSNHPNWTGFSTISNYLRKQISDWKKRSFESNDYRCVITGETARVVHHTYSFNKIVKETLVQLNLEAKEINEYTSIELNSIVSHFSLLHESYGLGIPLSKESHTDFHSLYGNRDNTREQFSSFLLRKGEGNEHVKKAT